MTTTILSNDVLMAGYRVARQWAFEHGHETPDDRMLGRVMLAAVHKLQETHVIERRPSAFETAVDAVVDLKDRNGRDADRDRTRHEVRAALTAYGITVTE